MTEPLQPAAPTIEELRAFAPDWCLFWPSFVSPAHFAIWRPYIARSRYRFIVMARNGQVKGGERAAIAALPNCMAMEATDETVRWLKRVPGFRGFLYVLGFKTPTFTNVNTFGNHAHVWIGHGESDKHASAPRTASLYDALFIGRYRRLSRFPRAIMPWVRRTACAIGAPIVDGAIADPWTEPRPVRTILYAPTWEGYSDHTNYSSVLDAAPAIAAAMPELRERGIRVIVRPHQSTGRRLPALSAALDELFTAGAERGVDKPADFAASDMVIVDISGANAEYLFTRKPSFMPVLSRLAAVGKTPDAVARDHPWAYQWDPATESLVDRIERLERSDPLRDRREAEARSVYRGHRSIEEAVRTFDLALGATWFRQTPIPVRWAFEVARVIGPAPRLVALVRRMLRITRIGRRAVSR
jgi:hypothetical protein